MILLSYFQVAVLVFDLSVVLRRDAVLVLVIVP